MKRIGMTAALAALLMTGSLTAANLTAPAELTNPVPMTLTVQDEFTEVEIDDLPDAVSKAVQEAYGDYEIDKAYVNTAKVYKLELKNDDQEMTVYFDESGKELEI